MPVTLRDVLSIDAVRRADPVVVHGAHLLDRQVRWVHTSELVEAAALLRGGELLLTTGLGLVGRGPVAQSSYVDELADRSVTAVALELGWSFSEVPEPLRLAAQRRDLPLLALRALVPFVEITEAVQTLIMSDELQELRVERHARAILDAVLSHGGGLSDLVAAVAEFLDVPAAVESADGDVIAEHPLGCGRTTTRPSQQHATTTAIDLRGTTWGWLHLFDVDTTRHAGADAIRQHAASAIGLVLLRDHDNGPIRPSLARALLTDLVDGKLNDSADALARAVIVEPALARSSTVVALAAVDDADRIGDATRYAANTAFAELGPGAVAVVERSLLALVAVRGSVDLSAVALSTHQRLTELLRLRGGTEAPVLAAGRVGAGLVDVGQVLDEARATARLASELGIRGQAITTDAFAGTRLLDRLAHDHEAERLVETQVGALVRYDAHHGTELAHTLHAYLLHAGSKVELADALHLRRQTLYQRLAKIEELVGSVDDSPRRATVLLALQVNQVRQARATRNSLRPNVP